MLEIPSTYFLSKFHQYGYNVSRNGDNYLSCCPYCREGKSWGKRKRLYYFPKENYLFCQNCSTHWHPYMWLKEIGGMTYTEIKQEMEDMGFDGWYYEAMETNTPTIEKRNVPVLPSDSINIMDETQLSYYKNDSVVKEILRYINKRRLNIAKYRPKAYYTSFTDSMHKHRLVIPYYNNIGEVIYYQSRAVFPKDENVAKYLFKWGAENKEIFNLDKVDVDLDRIYIMEGALDAMLVKNGISCGGVYVTSYQKNLINSSFPFHESVYILDNPRFDTTVDEKIDKLLENKDRLFFTWGGEFEKYKDFSQMAEDLKLNEISTEEIDKYVFSGKKAKAVFDKIRLNRN